MSTANHRFTIGNFSCMIVTDGSYDYPNPAQSLLGGAPADELEPVLREHNIDPDAWSTYVSPYPSLLIETGERCILVDMGAGSLGPKTGQLWPNLQQAGVAPEEIDTVFITHAHPDHLEAVPLLKKARNLFTLHETEWAWMATVGKQMAAAYGIAIDDLRPDFFCFCKS